MQDEATRRKWREHKRKWRAENPERNRELYRETYQRHRDTINAEKREMHKLFAEWRKTVYAAQGSASVG
ncbi:hypothetical protein [Mesorhizobium sp. B2-6-1]|uniref:hypothetical protein n=1 Tax=Mesorhizobium sp. B2-6-1 TaxID=2589916 RepID=UPI00112EBA8E|nr:hypothetical protein [Mesorhizobium sp. B2-6-1]TPJ59963.1 hypothetical protein FJ443_22485 [Mesorhizobium sp. B2-6-1]